MDINIDLESYVESRLRCLAEDTDLNEVQDFKNDVFEMHTYIFDRDCDCGCDAELLNVEEANPCTEQCMNVSGDCVCGADQIVARWICNNRHKETCATLVPNFRCGDLSISWYKHIGRGMEISREMTREELREMFRKCDLSLG